MEPETPVSEVETPVEAPVVAAPVDEEAALDAQIADQAIELPDGTDKLVPLSAVTTVREKLRTTKDEARTAKEEAARIKAEADELKRQWSEAAPYIEAAKTLIAAQHNQPGPKAPAAPAPDDPELVELAQTLDLYDATGKPDVARAAKVAGLVDRRAGRKVEEGTAPLVQNTVQQASARMFQNALITTGKNGAKPDPEILRTVWGQLDPKLTSTKEGALQAWNAALGFTVAAGIDTAPKTTTTQPAQTLPDPLLTEKAGGRDTASVTLNDSDRRAAKELGLSESEYSKILAKKPW